MEPFDIVLKNGSRKWSLRVEKVPSKNLDFETFRIFSPINPDNFLLIIGNRPLLRRRGLKSKRITWTYDSSNLKSSNVNNLTMVNQAIERIEAHIEP